MTPGIKPSTSSENKSKALLNNYQEQTIISRCFQEFKGSMTCRMSGKGKAQRPAHFGEDSVRGRQDRQSSPTNNFRNGSFKALIWSGNFSKATKSSEKNLNFPTKGMTKKTLKYSNLPAKINILNNSSTYLLKNSPPPTAKQPLEHRQLLPKNGTLLRHNALICNTTLRSSPCQDNNIWLGTEVRWAFLEAVLETILTIGTLWR